MVLSTDERYCSAPNPISMAGAEHDVQGLFDLKMPNLFLAGFHSPATASAHAGLAVKGQT